MRKGSQHHENDNDRGLMFVRAHSEVLFPADEQLKQ